MGRSNVFSLEQIYRKQLTGEWTNINDPYLYVDSYTTGTPAPPGGPAHGYSGGGGAGSFGSRETGGTRVERIDFANDTATASLRGSLAHDHLDCAAFGNATHGYVMGDSFTTTNRSWISRVAYASDTSTASPRGNMTVPRGGNSSTGNASYAWISGQYDWMPSSAGSYASVVDRIDFSNDNTTASPRGNLDRAVAHVGATGTANYGWWAGGSTAWNQPDTTSVSRIDYASDSSTASPKGTLSEPIESNTATGNRNYGYNIVGGPAGPSTPSLSSTIVRYDYASDTGASTPKGSLSVVRYDLAGATGSQEYGYFMGGYNPNTAPPYFTTVDRIDYSNDTATASPKGNLDQNAAGPSPGGYRKAGGFSGQSNGFGGAAVPPSFVPATQIEVGAPLGTDYGYTGGGFTMVPVARQSTVDRIDYSSDTPTMLVRGSLNNAASLLSSTSSQPFGYFAGGGTPTALTTVDRLDYSNDTTQTSPKGNLSVARLGGCPVGNKDFGYSAGGYVPSTTSSIDRIEYSNDTSTASPKGNTADAGIFHQAGTGNQSFGYIAGGSSTTVGTTVQRVEYSNDTATATPKGPLANQIARTASTGNGDFGYIAAGSDSLYMRTYVQRIDYSSDTSTTSPKGPVTLGRYAHSATSSTTHGYFTGGKSPSENTGTGWTTTDRIDYSNDTATAVVKSPLSAGRTYTTSTSSRDYANPTAVTKIVDFGAIGYLKTSPGGSGIPSPSYAYVIGGEGQPGPLPYANPAQRIDVTNDTAIAVAKAGAAPPTDRLYYSCSVGNRDYAWTSMGANYSNVQRMDYANDSAQMVNRCNRQPGLQLGYNETAVGNENYGYFNGGYILYTIPGCGSPQGATNLSYINRMTYASDTANTVLRSYNSNRAGMGGACGNNDYGYWLGAANGICGGYNGSSSWIERTDYANDTTNSTPKGSLSATVYANRGQGNKDYGWSNGGQYNRTRVERITYANDTATASPKGNLPVPHGNHQSTGTQSLGYVAGGNQPSSGTRIDRIDYSNDTAAASPKGNLVWIAYYGGGASASENGLTAVPPPPPVTSYIPRMRYVDSLLEGTGATQPAPTQYGYFAGGMVGGQGIGSTTVDRLDFASDTTTASVRGSLNIQRNQGDGAGNMNHGYLFGGRNNTTVVSSTERVDYANDTATASAKGNLAVISYFHATVGNNDFAYTGNHYTQNTGQIGKFDYSNDTATEVQFAPYTFTPASYGYAACGNRSYGYFAGGSYQTHVRRVDYSNDNTVASPRGPLSAGSLYSAGVGNADYGYVTISPNWYQHSRVTRIDYASDSSTTSDRAYLMNQNRTYRSAMGDNDYGYFTDGYLYSPQSAYSTLWRIDYASDTTNASPKGPLTTTVYSSQGFSGRENGNPQAALPGLTGIQAPFQRPFPFPVQNYDIPTTGYGYVAGGDYKTFVHRIDYANDTATAALRGNLPTETQDGGGAGNQSYGYTMGGYDGNSWGGASKVYRVDYANDTATASERGPLTSGRKYVHSVGNNNYGYTDGGYPSSTQSRIDRVDYANDTNTATSLGNIFSPGGRGNAAAGNLNYGYWGGGGGYIDRISTVTRLDYSNDTAPTSPRGPLSHVSSTNVAVGNANYGYWQISYFPSTRTQLDRVDYANDTATALSKGNLVAAGGYRQSATGNPNYGYFAGGYNYPSYLSTIQRITYANDTAIASPKGPLTNFTYDSQAFSAHENGLSG